MPNTVWAFFLFMNFRLFTLVILLLLSSTTAFAHKLKNAFTIVLFNERSGYLEVMHRFYLHDAEEAVWELFDKDADIISDEQTQQLFSNYVVERFAIKDSQGKQLPLNLLGYQNDGGYFWIYQDLKLPNNISQIDIKHTALQDIWSEQFNVVNVEQDNKITTLSFSSSDRWLTAHLSQPTN